MLIDDKKLADINHKLMTWFTQVKNNEMVSVVEMLAQAKLYLTAAEELSEDKIKQFLQNLQYDLSDFYQQTRSDAKHSIYLALMLEASWQQLANMTDKSQLEWAELADDLKSNGQYATGDVIGFGILECQSCLEQQHITHFSHVYDCLACGHDQFSRLLLEP
jgi:hypothetical protein